MNKYNTYINKIFLKQTDIKGKYKIYMLDI